MPGIGFYWIIIGLVDFVPWLFLERGSRDFVIARILITVKYWRQGLSGGGRGINPKQNIMCALPKNGMCGIIWITCWQNWVQLLSMMNCYDWGRGDQLFCVVLANNRNICFVIGIYWDNGCRRGLKIYWSRNFPTQIGSFVCRRRFVCLFIRCLAFFLF